MNRIYTKLVNSNLEKITELKKDIGFVENLTGLDAKLQYYKLYKAALKATLAV